MRREISTAVLIVLLSFAFTVSAGAFQSIEKQDVKVLYAGNPDDSRTEDFKGFLEKYFIKVGTVPYEKFKPSDADDYDVIIFDWGKILDREASRLKMPKNPTLHEDFSRPMILIGGPSITIAEAMDAKLGWL